MSQQNQITIKSYDKTAKTFEDTSPQKVDGQLKAWIDKSMATVPKTAKILEIGSGTGKDADYIESLGYVMECTDASQAFVELLQSRGREARLLDAISDDLGAGYDLVFANAVLLHFTEDDTKLVLKKVHGALNSGGIFMFTLKRGNNEEMTDRKVGQQRYFKYWEPNQVEALLANAGFSNIKTQTYEDFRKDGRPDWVCVTAQKEAL